MSGPSVVRDVAPLVRVEHGAARSSALHGKVPLLFALGAGASQSGRLGCVQESAGAGLGGCM